MLGMDSNWHMGVPHHRRGLVDDRADLVRGYRFRRHAVDHAAPCEVVAVAAVIVGRLDPLDERHHEPFMRTWV